VCDEAKGFPRLQRTNVRGLRMWRAPVRRGARSLATSLAVVEVTQQDAGEREALVTNSRVLPEALMVEAGWNPWHEVRQRRNQSHAGLLTLVRPCGLMFTRTFNRSTT
jgi:hypothetical protein